MKDRILELIEDKNLTLAAFADAIGIERATMSHIKAERSKPSLDVAQKILTCYPEVSAEWLILGRGPKYVQINDPRQPTLFDILDPISSVSEESRVKTAPTVPQQTERIVEKVEISAPKRSIERIIAFYDDGTFEEIVKTK